MSSDFPAAAFCLMLPDKWSAGESNPDFLRAKQASSRWTSVPIISFLLLFWPPAEWHGWESNPQNHEGLSFEPTVTRS